LDAVGNERSPSQTTCLTELLASKPFLKIGEVAKLIGVKPHVLRYWESEIPSLKPKKNPSGQRIYAKADVETIVEIKNLLYNQRYTISGVKLMMARHDVTSEAGIPGETVAYVEGLVALKERVHELLALLQQPLVS
jgi:DNA-binding transcriptional MerR regulator